MKYNNYFWEHRIKNEKDTWGGLVSDKILNKESIFIQTNMYHHNDVHNEWACHGDVKSVKGFLIYVFIPTLIYSIVADGDDRGINYAVEEPFFPLEDLRQDLKDKHKEDLKKVYEVLEEVDKIPTDDREESIEYMKDLSYRFNNIWTKTEMNYYFEVYGSPEEIIEDIINGYREENMLDELEEYSELTIDQLKNLSDNIWTNDFIRMRFMDILNNKLYYATS